MCYTHRKRLETTLLGEKPDRTPVALWNHFPVDDQKSEALAKATIQFQNHYDFDLVKVMPTSSFCLKDWGVKDQWDGSLHGTRTYTHRVINHPEDWEKLNPLNPKVGYLGEQLSCLEFLQKEFKDHIPFLQTIFNPLSQAKNLIGERNLITHLRKYPDALHKGLETIKESTIRFIEAAKLYGISGVFFAIQHASYQKLTEGEYLEFGNAYDLPILEVADDLWANMAHIHGVDIMFDIIADYPVQILNWHDRDTAPTLSQGLTRFSGSVCGGISISNSFVLGTPEDIRQESRNAITQTNGKRFILSTGCVLPLNTPYGNIMAARKAVEELG